MNILLVGVNAKFIHSNLAIRFLQQYAAKQGYCANRMEFTINQHPADILRELYLARPDAVGFSCYLWNIALCRRLAAELRILLPGCLIFFGGPEVSPAPEEELQGGLCDLVLSGEGERSFAELCRRLFAGEDWRGVPGGFWLEGDSLCSAPPPPPLDLEQLPFPYPEGLDGLQNRIVYYEASRGCPFHCQYCLSSGTGGVRLRPLPTVLAELDVFLKAGVSQVKLVDRTFNCDKGYAMAVWQHLAERDNGVTNFHFEIAAELLDEEQLAFLNSVRPGLFQLEIGVQSTNPETLAAVKRITLPQKLTPIIRSLRQGRNIHLHLDLIAGLPFEGFARFADSFNYVWSLAPDQLQLGFLKLLKGSGLYADREKYGLICQPFPPYEVIRTPWLSHTELLRLQTVAKLVELYYNSGRFDRSVAYLAEQFPTPFDFFNQFGQWYEEQGLYQTPLSQEDHYTCLREFLLSSGRGDPAHFCWLARYDLCRHQKPKRFPDWMGEGLKPAYRDAIYLFLDDPENQERYLPEYAGMDTRSLLRAVHLEVFPFHPETGQEQPAALLFHYRRPSFPKSSSAIEVMLPAGRS